MRRSHVSALSFLSVVGVLALLYLSNASPEAVRAQSDCTTYNTQCAALTAVSSVKVQGPIKYWFDGIRIDSALPPAAAENFRTRVKAAADE
ncbi:MAG TPA: hypothetical protein VFS10_14675 [Pyrinomonadaceae bacterium]|nr:hypothetical protein [Pyrinomonadaceae bacterium]